MTEPDTRVWRLSNGNLVAHRRPASGFPASYLEFGPDILTQCCSAIDEHAELPEDAKRLVTVEFTGNDVSNDQKPVVPVTPESLEAHADWMESRRRHDLRAEAMRLREEQRSAGARRLVLEDLKPGVYEAHIADSTLTAIVTMEGRLFYGLYDSLHKRPVMEGTDEYLSVKADYTFTLLCPGDLHPEVTE